MEKIANNEAQPSRSEVLEKLSALSAGQITREQASAWAARWATDDTRVTEVSDYPAWEALLALHMADLNGGERPYLYDETDFRHWATELQTALP